MRGSALVLVATLVLGAVTFVPTAEAVATCDAARDLVADKPCPDVVCIGHSGGRWQTCLLRDLIPCSTHPCWLLP